MGGMTKKRKYGNPGSKSIVNEEEVGESGRVEGEKRTTDETVRQRKGQGHNGQHRWGYWGI